MIRRTLEGRYGQRGQSLTEIAVAGAIVVAGVLIAVLALGSWLAMRTAT